MLRMDRRSITILTVLSLLLYLFFSSRSVFSGREVIHAFVRTTPATLVGLGLSVGGVYLLSRWSPVSLLGRALLVACVIIPGSVISSAIGNALVYSVDDYFGGKCASIYCAHSRTPTLVLEAVIGNTFIWSSLFLVLLWVGSIDEARAAERREAAARDAAREAQLLALRYKVNPHFLFNSLNSLATLVNRGDREAAGGMIRELSDFLRYGLASDPIADVELEDEVDMQRRYLEIERCRFSHRLTLEVDVADDVRQARVPSLILQPLVENAIKHGVASTSAPVTVRIRAARRSPGQLTIEVEDDASGGTPARSFGIGLRNVAERLSTRFDGAAAIDARRLPRGGFRATLTLPLVGA